MAVWDAVGTVHGEQPQCSAPIAGEQRATPAKVQARVAVAGVLPRQIASGGEKVKVSMIRRCAAGMGS
jgi:hypothetical protein